MPKPFKPVKMHCPKHGAMRSQGDWVVVCAPDDDEVEAILHCAKCFWDIMNKLATYTSLPPKRKKRRQARKQAVPVEKHTRSKPTPTNPAPKRPRKLAGSLDGYA